MCPRVPPHPLNTTLVLVPRTRRVAFSPIRSARMVRGYLTVWEGTNFSCVFNRFVDIEKSFLGTFARNEFEAGVRRDNIIYAWNELESNC